jgi:hypothetical protein
MNSFLQTPFFLSFWFVFSSGFSHAVNLHHALLFHQQLTSLFRPAALCGTLEGGKGSVIALLVRTRRAYGDVHHARSATTFPHVTSCFPMRNARTCGSGHTSGSARHATRRGPCLSVDKFKTAFRGSHELSSIDCHLVLLKHSHVPLLSSVCHTHTLGRPFLRFISDVFRVLSWYGFSRTKPSPLTIDLACSSSCVSLPWAERHIRMSS